MTNRIAIVALLFCCGSGAYAQYVSGNTLHDMCEIQETLHEATRPCTLYVIGALDMAAAMQVLVGKPETVYCMPENSIREQSVDVVVQYLDKHPEERHFEAVALILLAMSEAFPCDTD